MLLKKLYMAFNLAIILIPISINASLPTLKISANIQDAKIYFDEEFLGSCIDGNFEKEINPGRYNLVLQSADFESNPMLYSEFINVKMGSEILINANLTKKRAEDYYYQKAKSYADMKHFLKLFPNSKHYDEMSNQVHKKENDYASDLPTLKSKAQKKLDPKLIHIEAFDGSINISQPAWDPIYISPHGPFSIQKIYKDYPGIANLNSFSLGKYEVTELFYDLVILVDKALDDETKYRENAEMIEMYLNMDIYKSKPKNEVTWYEAVFFCNALSKIHDLTPVYDNFEIRVEKDKQRVAQTDTLDSRIRDEALAVIREKVELDYKTIFNFNGTYYVYNKDANGFRLPTLDEWVFASRGGNKTKGFIYSGSNQIYNVAVFRHNSNGELGFVGSKLPNELGLHDMSGNVWEWCWDKYQTNERINRGGDYRNEESECKINYYSETWNNRGSNFRRDHNPPYHRSLGLGFRIARNMEE